MRRSKVLSRALIAVGLALILILGTHLALTAWADSRLEQLEEIWRSEVFRGLPPTEAFPPRETNEPAREVERLAAELGILFESAESVASLESATVAGSAAPPAAVSEGGSDPQGDLVRAGEEFLARAGVAESFDVGPFPVAASEAIARLAPTLDSLTEVLFEEDARWGLNVERGVEMSEIDYSAHLALHRVLVLSSWQALAAGDDDRARRRLDAARRLRDAIESEPILIAALVFPREVAREIPLRLRVCPGPEGAGRLAEELDLPTFYRRILRGEAWSVLRSMSRAKALSEAAWPISVLGGALSRAGLVHYAEAVESGARALEGASWQRFDADRFFEERRAEIPSWSSFSRVVFVNGYGGWATAVRTQLSLELLELVDTERQAWGGGDARSGPIGETVASSVDPTLSWAVQRSGDRTTFDLRDQSGESVSFDPSAPQLPDLLTRFELDLTRCDSVGERALGE